MEILLEQRFVHTRIGLVRNYCKLEDKEKYLNAGRFGDTFLKFSSRNIVPIDLTMAQGRNKRVKFFSHPAAETHRDIDESAWFEQAISCVTLDDKKVKKHYNNPFAEVSVEILERSIVKRGNKITITSSCYKKHRMYNHRYFKTIVNKNIFTFNFDTGNFQTISVNALNKKGRMFRTNSFMGLKNLLTYNPGIFKLDNLFSKHTDNYKHTSEYKKAINNKAYEKVLSDVFNLEPYQVSDRNNYKGFYDKMVELFVTHKKIGVPDHSYEHFLLHHYPTERYLKKNDRKLIAAVLDKYQIKSKLLIKLFHKYPYLDITAITKLCVLLGDEHTKYIGSLPDALFAVSHNHSAAEVERDFYGSFYSRTANFKISEKEKENMIKLLSDPEDARVLTNQYLDEIYDHFNMIDKIRAYDEEIMFKAKNYREFRDEHQELSKMISAIRKGWVTQYIFEDKTVQEIEEPIKSFKSIKIGPTLMGTDMDDFKVFKPHILKREEEYIEEGSFMHHCVASYVDHDKSLIVSIRNEDASDRITCEFNIQTGKMVQARHFCNKAVPEEFEKVLEIVQDKIRLHARYGTLNWKEKKKVAYQINGKEVKQDGPRSFSEMLEM